MGENSTKPQKLSQILNEKVEHLKLTFNEGEINEQVFPRSTTPETAKEHSKKISVSLSGRR